MKEQLLKVSRPKHRKCEPVNVCEPATVREPAPATLWEPATKKQCNIGSMFDQMFKASWPNHVSCQPATCPRGWLTAEPNVYRKLATQCLMQASTTMRTAN